MSPDELVEAAMASGLDGICITEHDYFWSQEEIDELARRHRFLVLPGCEINTDAGHVLVFGLNEYEFGMHHPEHLRRLVDAKDGATVAAHPYRRRYQRGVEYLSDAYEALLAQASSDPMFSLCDGVEAVNGRAGEDENEFSLRLGHRLALSLAAGSDAHRREQVGRAATRFHRPVRDLADLIRELRAGRFEPASLNGYSSPSESSLSARTERRPAIG